MSWEQEISNKLQEAQSIAVRFDVEQYLTDAQKNTARNNIATTATATNVSGNDYKITFNY
jgi:hypothetical protein